MRPTSSRVREALFSLVGHDLAGQRVLDAFGGSGLLALEAWSRGAEVVVVERAGPACGAIRRNGEALGFDGTLVRGDVEALVGTLGTFHGVLADPPYADAPDRWLGVLAPAVASGGWLVLEAEGARRLPRVVNGLLGERPRHFGRTALWVYRRPR